MRREEEPQWNALRRAHDYPGFRQLCGAHLKQVAVWGDRWLALLGWQEAAVGIQIVSCDLAHIGPDTGRVRVSRTFVGEPGSPASLRHLAPCLGGPSGSAAEAGLAQIISFRQEPPSGPV